MGAADRSGARQSGHVLTINPKNRDGDHDNADQNFENFANRAGSATTLARANGVTLEIGCISPPAREEAAKFVADPIRYTDLFALEPCVAPMKEATARIKINKLLESASWWLLPENGQPANVCLEQGTTITLDDIWSFGDQPT